MPKVSSCRLEHHGASASTNRHALTWIPGQPGESSSSDLVYSSHAILNVARRKEISNKEPVWNVEKTLRSSLTGGEVITALSTIHHYSAINERTGLVCGFSNGAISLWWKEEGGSWKEEVLVASSADSITDICAMHKDGAVTVVAGSSAGATLYRTDNEATQVLTTAVNAVYLRVAEESVLLFLGTASPRHNKIHVYRLDDAAHYVGSLSGHEDWITSFDWSDPLLASGSQDCKIRLWRFRTDTNNNNASSSAPATDVDEMEADVPLFGDSDDESENEEEEEEGESRMEIISGNNVTQVTLDALLIGHEESVTSVRWHPRSLYGQDHLLISSSLDRAILLWGVDEDGIWAPLTRVGSAGGILGGSVGSSLLGYCHAAIEPQTGDYLVGHAYGGSLHMWTLEESSDTKDPRWKATPCVTGHFDGVTDLSWEASRGDYLLTVSNDQTCRLWSPVSCPGQSDIWLELARPQVHGYNLSAVTSASTPTHKHLMVTGADEKELRVFDAPKTTITTLQRFATGASPEDDSDRVERAFIPSLGLSNKASAADGAEQDESGDEPVEVASRLPLERDLGAVSLWPETRKLFGHNTELYCLASTLVDGRPLIASSCKARTVEDAAIRLWNVQEGTCVQTLAGGHKSTVATLSFSPDGQFLVSSGKDRRLCLWSRQSDGQFSLVWAKDSAHKRIVWSADFFPGDCLVFASGSRDGCVKVWKIVQEDGDDGPSPCSVLEMYSFAPHRTEKPTAVTALSFAPLKLAEDMALLALGLESGHLEFFHVSLGPDMEAPELISALSDDLCHIATVTKLAWRPYTLDPEEAPTAKLQLASCSMDWGCRIIEVKMEN